MDPAVAPDDARIDSGRTGITVIPRLHLRLKTPTEEGAWDRERRPSVAGRREGTERSLGIGERSNPERGSEQPAAHSH